MLREKVEYFKSDLQKSMNSKRNRKYITQQRLENNRSKHIIVGEKNIAGTEKISNEFNNFFTEKEGLNLQQISLHQMFIQ